MFFAFCFDVKEKIDSLLLDEQFLVNRTGSWLKTVEWLCHLTSMSIESLQAGTFIDLMIENLKKVHTSHILIHVFALYLLL